MMDWCKIYVSNNCEAFENKKEKKNCEANNYSKECSKSDFGIFAIIYIVYGLIFSKKNLSRVKHPNFQYYVLNLLYVFNNPFD